MKKLLLYSLFAFAILLSPSVMAQQGFGTNEPDRSAAVDIVSTKRGLLIPRIALTSTDAASPVTAPANSLLVYNTATSGAGATAVTPGFYFWDTDHWERFFVASDYETSSVVGGDGVTVTSETTDGNTEYEVSITAGAGADMVMVTIENPDFGDPGEPEFITSWVSYDDLLDDLINVENGLTYDPLTNTITLGGALTEPTTITTDDVNTLTLLGLQEWDDDVAGDGDLANAQIVVLNEDGTLRVIDYSDSVYTAANGLYMDENEVRLGGALTEATTITTDGNEMVIATDAVGTLAVDGLEEVNAANKIVVAEDAGGVLRTVTRTLYGSTTNASFALTDVPDYSSYAQEIHVDVTLGAAVIDFTLPAATAANNGQVVNIKITNIDDTHDGELSIEVTGGGTLTYGAMPYQGWIVKSNGNSWVIVGRN